jgi:hypothetical protein
MLSKSSLRAAQAFFVGAKSEVVLTVVAFANRDNSKRDAAGADATIGLIDARVIAAALASAARQPAPLRFSGPQAAQIAR